MLPQAIMSWQPLPSRRLSTWKRVRVLLITAMAQLLN
jgi:hypothetical protein